MVKTDPLQTEQEHHQKAFELYYSLGEKRTYRQVAAQLGISVSAVKLWSRSFGWRQRIAERDAESARRVADHALHSEVNERGHHRKIVQMALLRLAKGIAAGQVKMQMGDLERLIRLQAHLESPQHSAESARTPLEIAAFLREYFLGLDSDTQREVIRILWPLENHASDTGQRHSEDLPTDLEEGTENCP